MNIYLTLAILILFIILCKQNNHEYFYINNSNKPDCSPEDHDWKPTSYYNTCKCPNDTYYNEH